MTENPGIHVLTDARWAELEPLIDEVLGAVPSGPVHQHDPMGSGSHGLCDFRQVQAHGLRVALGHDQGCALALLRADRPEDVDRACPLILRGARPGAPSGPAPVVLPPQF